MLFVFKTWILMLMLAPGLSGLEYRAGQGAEPSLPNELTEAESQSITGQSSPKSHVSAAVKVSETRINASYRLVSESNYKSAAGEFDVVAALYRYADNYTRGLGSSKQKDRNNCYKIIEQSIFRNTRTMEAVVRDLPLAYREPAEKSFAEIKKIRLRAINDLLGGGKVIESSNE